MLKFQSLLLFLLALAALWLVFLRFTGYYTLYFWIAAVLLLLLGGRSSAERERFAKGYILLLCVLGAVWQIVSMATGWGAPPLWNAALGALVCAVPLWGLDLLLTRIGKRETPLFGVYSIALLGSGGFLLGWRLGILALMLGFLMGGFSSAFRSKAKKEENLPVNYTSFFAASVFLSGVFGPSFLQWYFSP